MKLNHLDLQVPDVQQSVTFFERHFGLRLTSSRTSPAIALLSDEHGFTLVLQRAKDGSSGYPEGFHVGFLVDDDETVERFQQGARADGLRVSELDRNARGLTVYCHAPGGFLVEVSHRRAR